MWGPPSVGPRSRVLSHELGVGRLEYVYCTRRRGLLSSFIKYPWQALKTLTILCRTRPRIVFVQSPPSPAVMCVCLYCTVTGACYFIDAHSAAFQLAIWRHPVFLTRCLARKAVATIVTNEEYARIIQGWGACAFVLRDIPTSFQVEGGYPLSAGFHVAVVNTYSSDEPLAEIIKAAEELPDVRFHVSGDTRRAPQGLVDSAPDNVRFTGFLPDSRYYALLSSVDAVLCLTTRDSTMQRGACEGLSCGKPLITSDWPLLRDYFRCGAVHVSNTSTGIRDGVLRLQSEYSRFLSEIRALREARQREWEQKRRALVNLASQVLH